MERTIALIGNTRHCKLYRELLTQPIRILLVGHREHIVPAGEHQAEVELAPCEKEGCWEADIVVFEEISSISATLLERVKQVTTKKIVVLMTKKGEDIPGDFKKKLCNAHLVRASYNEVENTVGIEADHFQIESLISSFFENLGVQVK